MNTSLKCMLMLALLASACSKTEKEQKEADSGTPIDSNVIGRDSSPFPTRKDIELDDAVKQTLPGRDTTNSDEPQTDKTKK